jgi:hypothetical protein
MMFLVSCRNLKTEHPIFVLQLDNPPLQRVNSSFHVVVHLCGIAIVKFVSRVMLHCCTPRTTIRHDAASENSPNRLYEFGIKVPRVVVLVLEDFTGSFLTIHRSDDFLGSDRDGGSPAQDRSTASSRALAVTVSAIHMIV